MINKLRNDFIDRFDMNNFYMGILFIILEELAFHFLLVIIILTISIHIPYIQHKKEMQTELLVFIELLNTKLQNNNL